MYDRKHADYSTFTARAEAHDRQNKSNIKRNKQGKCSIDSFPKQEFKLPDTFKALRNLKTFIVADELEQVKAMPVQDLFHYLFRNMLAYNCNLIFNNNFDQDLKYYYDNVKVKKADYKVIFSGSRDTTPSNTYEKDGFLYFKFSFSSLKSLNKNYNNNPSGKARQYILFNFSFLFLGLRYKLGAGAKDFLLLIISLYKHSKHPKINHSLSALLHACNISLRQSKQTAIDRINKYFSYLNEWELLQENFLDYQFTVDDLTSPRSLNIYLNPIDCFYSR